MTNQRVANFSATAGRGEYEQAVDLLPEMTVSEIAEAVVKIRGAAQVEAGRVGLRDAAKIIAEAKIAERVAKSANLVAYVGIGLGALQVVLAIVK